MCMQNPLITPRDHYTTKKRTTHSITSINSKAQKGLAQFETLGTCTTERLQSCHPKMQTHYDIHVQLPHFSPLVNLRFGLLPK